MWPKLSYKFCIFVAFNLLSIILFRTVCAETVFGTAVLNNISGSTNLFQHGFLKNSFFQDLKYHGAFTWQSEYLYRGVDLSGGEPALMYSVFIDNPGVLQLRTWSSEVDTVLMPGVKRHSALSISKTLPFNTFKSLAANYTRYQLGRMESENAYYSELGIHIHLDHRFSFSQVYIDNPYDLGKSAWLTELRYIFPLTPRLDLKLLAGYSKLDKTLPFNYANYSLAFNYALKNCALNVAFHTTTNQASKMYAEAAKDRVLASISVGF